MIDKFLALLNEQQRALFTSLDSPNKIQAFLDQTPYSAEDANRSPLSVLRDRQAHCLDGSLFAAAALYHCGEPPIVIDMLPDPGEDDDHVLAIYRRNGRYGAIAKSNFSTLRFREPVYRSLRELVMSYFEFFFNLYGVKTLRSYTRPLDLTEFDPQGWLWDDRAADAIEHRLGRLRRTRVIDEAMAAGLSPVDRLTYQAGMLGVNKAGLYRPKSKPQARKSPG
jgi:hypothetical protein